MQIKQINKDAWNYILICLSITFLHHLNSGWDYRQSADSSAIDVLPKRELIFTWIIQNRISSLIIWFCLDMNSLAFMVSWHFLFQSDQLIIGHGSSGTGEIMWNMNSPHTKTILRVYLSIFLLNWLSMKTFKLYSSVHKNI